MARGFSSTLGVGSTDKISTSSSASPAHFSASIWFWRRNASPTLPRLIDKNNGEILIFYNGTAFELQRGYTTTGGVWRSTDAGLLAHSVWNHLVVTHDGTATVNNAVFYLNGREVTVSRITGPSGTALQNSSVTDLGNRADSSRTWDGLISDFAMWADVTLTQAEAMALFSGAGPRDIQGRYLQEYIQMRSGRPESLKRAQPVVVGTRIWPDRLAANDVAQLRWLQAPTGGVSGGASGDFGLTGSTTGGVAVTASVAASIGFTGASSGVSALQGSFSGAIGLTGSASSSVAISGSLDGGIQFAGAAAGAVQLTGDASGSMSLVGTASGYDPSSAIMGASLGLISFTGTATGLFGGFRISGPPRNDNLIIFGETRSDDLSITGPPRNNSIQVSG